MSARGVVAAGHPLTAEAGAAVLRDGGNAVDAAVAAMLTSCITESPLTGMGAGGYMLVHSGGESVVLDFFVSVPGMGRDARRGADLVPIPIWFTPETPQTFHAGAASVGVPGTPAGIEEALRRFGSMPLGELTAAAARLARDGFVVDDFQGYFLRILEPILTFDEDIRAVYAPEGRILRSGERLRFPALGDLFERFGADGAAPFYHGEIAHALSDRVLERGGTLGREDLARYEPIARAPLVARFGGREVLTNPPPSAGGVLIGFVLEVLARAGRTDFEALVGAMDQAQAARTEDFLDGLIDEGFAARFLASEALDAAASRLANGGPAAGGPDAGGALGSTTHITALDADGGCASVTCSNGSGSGVLVPGTGVHLNNMLGEEDLNPYGFHRHAPGRRMPSMMAPTVVLRDGVLEAGLGSGGSNRIRSAVTQAVLRLLADGLDVASAVDAARIHYEEAVVQAEPGVDERALLRLEERGYTVFRWAERNVFFGGVHAVVRNAETGELGGAGDPRRGGAVAYA